MFICEKYEALILFVFFQYLNDIGCCFSLDDRNALIDWLLGFAVRLEYGDNGEFFIYYIKDYRMGFQNWYYETSFHWSIKVKQC